MKNEQIIEMFEEAFRTNLVGSYRECHCGKVYYNSGGMWDWEEGHLEALEKSEYAIDLDYSVGTIMLEGNEYCMDCTCWHDRALKIYTFLAYHSTQIIELFKIISKQKQKEAKMFSTEDIELIKGESEK